MNICPHCGQERTGAIKATEVSYAESLMPSEATASPNQFSVDTFEPDEVLMIAQAINTIKDLYEKDPCEENKGIEDWLARKTQICNMIIGKLYKHKR